jgi:carbonic anhydrase
MEVALILALTAVGIAVVVAVRHHVVKSARERVEAIRAVADRLGWAYRQDVSFEAIPKLDRFELFRQGRDRKLRNLLTSPAGEPRAVLFEYTYTTGSGKSQATHRQTVFYATGTDLRVPSFSLRPEHFFHRIGAVFGMQDINLEQRPEFSRMYVLRGEDEDAVRAMFTDPVAGFFERRAGSCAAGVGREVLFWRPGRLLKPEELEAFIGEGMELASRLGAGAHRA